MCLRFVFLLITRVVVWLRLSRREEAWRITEILILRHQLAVLQRRQPCRPKLNWADRALLAILFGVIPKARRRGLRLLLTNREDEGGTQVAPETVPSTIAIGMITKIRKNEVSRLSGRSGYSTAN